MAKQNTPAAAPQTEQAPKTALPKQVIYLGPTMHEDGNVFSHGSIFSNGLPDYFEAKIALEPEFARLIVPVDKVPKILVELKDDSSHRSQLSRKFLEACRKRQAEEKK